MPLHGKNKASEKTSFFPGRRGVPYMGATKGYLLTEDSAVQRTSCPLFPRRRHLSGRLAGHAEFSIPGFQLEGGDTPQTVIQAATAAPASLFRPPIINKAVSPSPTPGQNIRNMAFQASPHKVPETAPSAKTVFSSLWNTRPQPPSHIFPQVCAQESPSLRYAPFLTAPCSFPFSGSSAFSQ